MMLTADCLAALCASRHTIWTLRVAQPGESPELAAGRTLERLQCFTHELRTRFPFHLDRVMLAGSPEMDLAYFWCNRLDVELPDEVEAKRDHAAKSLARTLRKKGVVTVGDLTFSLRADSYSPGRPAYEK